MQFYFILFLKDFSPLSQEYICFNRCISAFEHCFIQGMLLLVLYNSIHHVILYVTIYIIIYIYIIVV